MYRLALLMIVPLYLSALSVQPHHTTAFVGHLGEFDLLTSYSSYSTSHFWNGKGEKKNAFTHFRKDAVLLWAEYTLLKRDSLFVNGGYAVVREKLDGNKYGFEDAEVGWKHVWKEGSDSALTSQLTCIIPVNDPKSSLRYGKFGMEGALLYSKYFNCRSWTDLSLGYRWYTGHPGDQVRAMAAYGYNLRDNLQLIAEIDGIFGIYNGKSEHLNHIVNNPHMRLIKVQAEAVYRLYRWFSVSLGGYVHVWGQNVGTGGGGFGGVWIDI
jgi:hypothetical protein